MCLQELFQPAGCKHYWKSTYTPPTNCRSLGITRIKDSWCCKKQKQSVDLQPHNEGTISQMADWAPWLQGNWSYGSILLRKPSKLVALSCSSGSYLSQAEEKYRTGHWIFRGLSAANWSKKGGIIPSNTVIIVPVPFLLKASLSRKQWLLPFREGLITWARFFLFCFFFTKKSSFFNIWNFLWLKLELEHSVSCFANLSDQTADFKSHFSVISFSL